MPNYEYKCTGCNHKWEDIQTIGNRDLPLAQACPQCGTAGTVARGWDSAPTMGVDATKQPPKAFRERMENMRSKLGKYNPTVRNNIDRALDMRGTKYGAQ
jgi:putative FmdB family regulatory protein